MHRALKVEVPLDIWPRRKDWTGKVVSIVEPGAIVDEGSTLAEVEVEKSIIVVESPARGRVVEVHVRPGDTVKPGMTLVTLEADSVA